jgi:hypothetical protein
MDPIPELNNLPGGVGPHKIIVSYNEKGEHNISWIYSDCPEFFKQHLKDNNIGNYAELGCCGDRTKWDGIPSHWEVNDLNDVHIHKVCPVAKKLVICTNKAKSKYTDKLRAERNAMLQKLDGEYMMALEQGKPTKAILEKKQKLRDMPNHPIWNKCKTKQDFENVTLDKL